MIIVTRHSGLVEWLAKQGITGDVITHVDDIEQIRMQHGAIPVGWHLLHV